MVGDAEARATHVLGRNWSTVREIAQALLEHETLSGVALDALLSPIEQIDVASLSGIERVDLDDEDLGKRRPGPGA